MPKPLPGAWTPANPTVARRYQCGHCGATVAPTYGLDYRVPSGVAQDITVRICVDCNRPTYLEQFNQFPGVPFGNPVNHLPPEMETLYQETRRCTSASAYTPAVLACRKMLMHIAVDKSAPAGLSFMEYVEFLSSNGYIPPDGKGWVDHIRKKGNEANHEILLMNQQDAQELVSFVEMLLKFIYEFPNRIPKPPVPAAPAP